MQPQLTIPVWLSLPMETRLKIAQRYKLKRSGNTEVTNLSGKLEVKSDGYTHEDLAKIPIGGKDPLEILNRVLAELERPSIAEENPLPFCQHCDSKGTRHKSDCKRHEVVQA